MTILYDILANNQVCREKKWAEHLEIEIRIFIGAGTVTTNHILLVVTFHVVNNREILDKLLLELKPFMGEDQTLATKRQLGTFLHLVRQ